MARNRSSASVAATPDTPAGSISPQDRELLGRVAALLAEGQAAEAGGLVVRSGSRSPWAANARGVCLLRQGRAAEAVDLFRSLVLGPGGVTLREGTPVVFKVNYAAALIRGGNVAGGQGILAELGGERHPAADALRAALRRWEAGLTLWQWSSWRLGGEPARPVDLGPEVGALE